MDSPERTKIVASSSSDSPSLQQSPFYRFLDSLSPIQPPKVPHHTQAFSDINVPTPPPVFSSPRLNPQLEAVFLKRAQYSRSKAELSHEHEERVIMYTEGSDAMTGLVPYTKRGSESKGVQSSPLGCVDAYLVDPEVDGAKSSDSAESSLKQVKDAPKMLQDGCSNSKQAPPAPDDDGDQTKKDMESDIAALEKTEGDTQEKSLKCIESDKQKDGEGGPDLIMDQINDMVLFESAFEPVSPLENCQSLNRQDGNKQRGEGGQNGEKGDKVQVLPETLQNVACKNHNERSGTISCGPVENRTHNFEDAGLNQRGSRRRCLQFEAAEARRKSTSKGHCISNPTNIAYLSRFPATQMEVGLVDSSIPDLATSGSNHVLNIVPLRRLPATQMEVGSVDSSNLDPATSGSNHVLNIVPLRRLPVTQMEVGSVDSSNLDPATSGSNHVLNIVPLRRLPVTQMEVGSVDLSNLDPATSSSNHIVSSSQPMTFKLSLCPAKKPEIHVNKFDGCVGNGGNTPRKTPFSAGFGLHLNSIVNSAAMGNSAGRSIDSAENRYPNAPREKSPCLLEESKSSSLQTVAAKNFPTKSDDDQQEIQSTVDSSASFGFPHENDRLEEFNQLSPKKKRKRYPTETEGCKRCNCRRSKCLKLYCECFAAGLYCSEPCACQECFNKPEFKDTVLDTRQHILSRNPLAFAPKVVRRAAGSPANCGKNDSWVTPSSARHKRGCNCKKSMCLKKYCECYQAGVGCSDGCRCEGCKNVFGAKEGYAEISEMVYKKTDDDHWEDLPDGKLVIGAGSNFPHPNNCHPHNLTPSTPLFQHSNHGKNASKSRVPARRYLPSPESGTNIISSYVKSPRSPRSSDIQSVRGKTGGGGLDIVFYDQELEFSATGRVDQFSPRWDGLEDICHLTPLPRPPPRPTNVSSSSNTDCVTVSRIQLQGSVRLSGSLRWRSSPITPMSQLGGNKLPQQHSDSGYDILEDETPEILKDTHTPIKAVKVSSPNQKRVSPPHAHLKELRSSASPGLRSGRKFVLQSISSFPPLTPCSEPKSSSNSDKGAA